MDKFIKHRALHPLGWLAVDVVFLVRRMVAKHADEWVRL